MLETEFVQTHSVSKIQIRVNTGSRFPADYAGVGALGPIWEGAFGSHLGSLVFGAHVGSFGVLLYFVWSPFVPIWGPFLFVLASGIH